MAVEREVSRECDLCALDAGAGTKCSPTRSDWRAITGVNSQL